MTNTLTTGCRQQSDPRTTNTVETNFHYSFPPHGTQKSRLLAAMLAGRQINPLTAWLEFGTYRLADAVFQLKRKNGWPVRTDDLTVNNTFGEECVVALYSLAPNAIAQAGSEAQQFVADEREVLRAMRRAA